MYPQGCDVCNHLSLFLCVADYDKLLPGECLLVCMLLRLQQTTMHHQHSCRGTQSLLRSACLQMCSWCRLEPFCTVYHCCCEQGPKEVQVLRYAVCITAVMFGALHTVGFDICLLGVVQLQQVASLYLSCVVTSALQYAGKLVPCKSGPNA